jgi:predicted amidohydrolase
VKRTARKQDCASGPAAVRPTRLVVALVQFNALPEQAGRNLRRMETLARRAADQGARLVMFHEGTLTDYTPRLSRLAQRVPAGPAVRRLERLARRLGIYLSFGLSEREGERYYISQVFLGPQGYIYHYRKTWLWRQEGDPGYRDEHARYDPGSGPELFDIAGLRATCFICADGEAPRCIERARALRPQLVFYPNNRERLPGLAEFGRLARRIGAPMLVTNRTGLSWIYRCQGGCAAYDARGRVLAAANRQGRQEILLCDVPIDHR